MSEATPPGQAHANPDAGAPETANSGGMEVAGHAIPTPSKTHLLVGAVVVLAIVLFYLRSRSSSGDDDADAESADPDEWVEDGNDDDTDYIEVPVSPDSELDKDEAVIEGLKEDGKLSVLTEGEA